LAKFTSTTPGVGEIQADYAQRWQIHADYDGRARHQALFARGRIGGW